MSRSTAKKDTSRERAIRLEAQTIRRKQMASVDRCEVCRWRVPKILMQGETLLNLHHVIPVQCGGSNEGGNLVMICPNCHAIAHRVYGVRRGVYIGPSTKGSFIAGVRGYLDDPTGMKRARAAMGVGFGLDGAPMDQQRLAGLDQVTVAARIAADYPTWGRRRERSAKDQT